MAEQKRLSCKNFRSPQGCSFGAKCRFAHDALRASTSDASDTPLSPKECPHFNTASGCRFGDKCKNAHVRKGFCKFFNSAAGCSEGDKCRFEHVAKKQYEDPFAGDLRSIALHAEVAEDTSFKRAPGFEPSSLLSPPELARIELTREQKFKNAVDAIARMHRVSLCFVLDTTGSMSSHMQNVKEQINGVVARLKETGCAVENVAFMGYKDWCDGDEHFQAFPFSPDTSKFSTFLGAITAGGGGDLPEDVLGGLERATRLTWPESAGTRVIFHMGDAPPHGTQYYTGTDSFPGGHPKDMPLKDLFGLMRSKQILYFFGELNDQCKNMKEIFSKELGRPVDEIALKATTAEDLIRSVTLCTRNTATIGMSSVLASTRSTNEHPYRLDTTVPTAAQLAALPEQIATLIEAELLSDIALVDTDRTLHKRSKRTSIRVCADPFARGGLRFAFYGRKVFRSKGDMAGPSSEEDFVFKEFIAIAQSYHTDFARYLVDLETQVVAAKLATDYSAALKKAGKSAMRVKYLKTAVVECEDPRTKIKRVFSAERRFFGKVTMVKYTNNFNMVENAPPGRDLAEWARLMDFVTAFSHYSYHISSGHLLVCDLQGIEVEKKVAVAAAAAAAAASEDGDDTADDLAPDVLLLTDPAIHCLNVNRFGSTNLREPGMKAFFSTHKCGESCRALGLTKPAFA